MRSLLAAAALATGALLLGGVGAASADTTVTVNPGSLGSGATWFTADTKAQGAGAFRFGPAPAPLGAGSYQLSTPVQESKAQLLTKLYAGTRMDAIQGIGYKTFRDAAPSGSVGMPALNVRVSLTGTSGTTSLVYEPYYDRGNDALRSGEWQTWDAFRGGEAKWWIANGSGGCGQVAFANACTWNRILQLYPNAVIREQTLCPLSAALCGSLGLNQGTYNPGVVASADELWVTTGGNKTTYDFEPIADATKPSCGALVIRRGGGPGGKDEADVTISDTGSGIASITNFTVSNGTAIIPAFTPGAASVTVTARKGTQGESTQFEFDVTDQAGNTTHCV